MQIDLSLFPFIHCFRLSSASQQRLVISLGGKFEAAAAAAGANEPDTTKAGRLFPLSARRTGSSFPPERLTND